MLLLKVLEYHHIRHNKTINNWLLQKFCHYHQYSTDTYITDPLIVGKGVLQGDCLSPLLFDMVINTLIKTKGKGKTRCMRYNFCNSLAPRNWFQFADNSALVTLTEQDRQLLLNLFTKWCKWENLIVRVDKYKSFRIKKNGTYQPQFKF